VEEPALVVAVGPRISNPTANHRINPHTLPTWHTLTRTFRNSTSNQEAREDIVQCRRGPRVNHLTWRLRT